MDALVSVSNLSVALRLSDGRHLPALRGIDFAIQRGGTLGLVGESGSGKSMTALALMGLLPEGARAAGSLRLDGEELLNAGEARWCELRGDRVAMTFQEPMSALNPVVPIGQQVAEPLRIHRGLDRTAAEEEAVRLLDRVGLPEPRRRLAFYPHQLSGGQRQRAMIAMALACGPALLIADEPTTALDATIQGQVLALLRELVEERGMALLLISHDLNAIGETVDTVAVMYGGAIVEQAPVGQLFTEPTHPYTRGLLAAIPSLDPVRLAGAPRERLQAIPGSVPDLSGFGAGCTFAGRCPHAIDACRAAPPPMINTGGDQFVACIRLNEIA
jgi:peptide/nickel transport system ATP-binding protein